MLLKKSAVTGKSIIAFILLLFLWPVVMNLGSSQLEGVMPLDEIYSFVLLFTIYGVPVILLIGFPVTIFAGMITKRLRGYVRVTVNFAIHTFSAAVAGYILFGGVNEIAVLPIIVATCFFVFDEWKNVNSTKLKAALSAAPLAMVVITVALIWVNNYQVEQDLQRLDEVGHPTPVVMINGEQVEEIDPASSYSSTEIGDRSTNAPYLLPKGILNDSEYTVWDVEKGDTISVYFENKPNDNFEIEVTYLLNGQTQKETLSGHEFLVPEDLEPQSIFITGVWQRHMVSFGIFVK
ncbi:hypothetical protein LGQ02_19040 [Bacillus shivajii]|uniref:hypothetical protein n=1 Tax=Bacillus shivajii TaxID=1983719 RepID=UPI001CFBECDF|nr:hypothetical protein [Bacillus shivajii]UCZ52852.1 hypothetical protein LGQ02_19040 [Bacillus shivajii]